MTASRIPVVFSLPGGRQFYEALVKYGRLGRWNPEDMLRLVLGESDGISTRNQYGYSGITQIGVRELKNLGYDSGTRGEFHEQPPHVQLLYSYKYFEGWRQRAEITRWESAGHLWHCNLAPAHLGSTVVYSTLTHGAQVRANKWLDINDDGVIERSELDVALERACNSRHNAANYKLGLANLQVVKMQLALQEAERAKPDPRYDLRVPDPLHLDDVPDATDPLGLKRPGER